MLVLYLVWEFLCGFSNPLGLCKRVTPKWQECMEIFHAVWSSAGIQNYGSLQCLAEGVYIKLWSPVWSFTQSFDTSISITSPWKKSFFTACEGRTGEWSVDTLLCKRSRQIISEDLMVLSTQTADASGERPSTAYNIKEDTCNYLFCNGYLQILQLVYPHFLNFWV